MNRRRFLANVAASAFVMGCPAFGVRAGERFDLAALKPLWAKRLEQVAAGGQIPIIDIESSCNPNKLDIDAFIKVMDSQGIALSALSADLPKGDWEKGKRWSGLSHKLMDRAASHFIPTSNGGVDPAWTRDPGGFLDNTIRHAQDDGYPLLGEFEFRHYPSPRQVKRGEFDRDVSIPIDGPEGERLFRFSSETGLPFQIHYEVEEALLAPLETMLDKYPKAKVIWCHLAQIRYGERVQSYNPDYVARLLGRFPNLYFDLAFGTYDSFYSPSAQRHARIWSGQGKLDPAWADLIVRNPWRFLSALDLGGDRIDSFVEWAEKHREFLNALPDAETRRIVAHGSAWNLLFQEKRVF